MPSKDLGAAACASCIAAVTGLADAAPPMPGHVCLQIGDIRPLFSNRTPGATLYGATRLGESMCSRAARVGMHCLHDNKIRITRDCMMYMFAQATFPPLILHAPPRPALPSQSAPRWSWASWPTTA